MPPVAGAANPTPTPVNTMQNVAIGQTQVNSSNLTTTLQVATGGTIDQLFLKFPAGVTEANIRSEMTGNIRMDFDGKEIVNCKLSRLLDLYKQLGSRVGGATTLVAEGLPLNLGPLFFASPTHKLALGLGTADVSQISVQVDCGAIVNCTSSQIIKVSRPVNQVLGTYASIHDYLQPNYNAIGTDDVLTLPRTVNTAYLAMMVNAGSAGVIKSSEVAIGQVPLRQAVAKKTNDWLNRQYGLQTDAADAAGDGAYFTHVFNRGDLTSYLPMKNVTDLRVSATFSTAPGAGGYCITPVVLTQFAGS